MDLYPLRYGHWTAVWTLDSDDKSELRDVIEAYRAGRIPLLAPITLLRHHFPKHPHPWVEQQVYLRPEPAENLLRRGGP